MRLSDRLIKFNKRLDELEHVFVNALKVPRSKESDFVIERATIQIQIEWEHFVRGVILDSATGNYSNTSGTVYSKNFSKVKNREVAASLLISTYKKRLHEPDWYLPLDAIQAAQNLDVSNLSIIAAELGVTPWEIDELRHIRNFIAHKSKRAAIKIRDEGIVFKGSTIDPVQIAKSYASNGIIKYSNWMRFIKGVAVRLTY